MELFQLWVVLNSCVFMMLYFLSFLLLKYPALKSALICAASAAAAVVIEMARIHLTFHAVIPKLIVTSLNIIILQGTALLLSKKKDAYALFIGFSSSNFVFAGNIISCGVILVWKSQALAMAACTLANGVVFFIMAVWIRDICVHMLSKEISIWMCVIPAMSYITFFFILYCPVSFEERPESIIAALSLLVTLVALYVLLIHYIYVKSKEKSLIWKNTTLTAYLSGVEAQSDAVNGAIREFSVMRHDMRHKDSLLIELLRGGNYSEAERILQKDIEYLDQKQPSAYCDHIVLNSILSGMAKKARQRRARLHIFCSVPKEIAVNDYDLAMLTANLVENALQAAEKLKEEERIVTLTVKSRDGGAFFFEIQNPCEKKVFFSKKTGLPCSRRGLGHGYGMISVQNFVEKYHAQFDCCMEGKMFIVRILVQ